MALSGNLEAAVAAYLTDVGGGGRRDAAAELSRVYRGQGSSAAVDPAAYLVARLPATFAAVTTVLAEVARLRPGFAPTSLIDAGCGPGTASWAAAALWDSLGEIRLLDRHRAFLAIAARLAPAAGHQGLQRAEAIHGDFTVAGGLPESDLVIAAYALAEVPLAQAAPAAEGLWQRAHDMLVLVEPGTPAGFARIAAARQRLLSLGGHTVGPCPHGGDCPVTAPGWCHFAVRLPRLRAHMHAKGASVPFEDETFSWFAAARQPAALPRARIVAPPRTSKAAVTLQLCTASGLASGSIARRDAAAFRQARKLAWGDAFEVDAR
ncbi:MAG: SAM-dependent methyltransferase [Rhizobiales bacterium]|nr:SAM-dependent methyltransferase [Hyphomicrobiales bacterium]MBI3672588.1 SAM-dependent methyltransferase [Hyphomicrobiales bacterium]